MKHVLMTEDQQKKVLERVKSLEARVDVEVVPMLVVRSSAIGHVRLVLFLILLILLLLLDATSFFWLSPKIEVMIFVAGLVVAFFLSKYLLRYPQVQRWLTSDADEEVQVKARAELEFHRGLFHKTERGNSILLFCSSMEQRAYVFSDPEIQKLISEDFRGQIKGVLTLELKKNRPDLGFIQAMDLIEAALKDKAPAPKNKANEVTNEVRIKD